MNRIASRFLRPKEIFRFLRGSSQVQSFTAQQYQQQSSFSPLTQFSEEETLMRDAGTQTWDRHSSKLTRCIFQAYCAFAQYWYRFVVAKFAKEEVEPLVRDMDDKSEMPRNLIDKIFQNGVRFSPFVLCMYMYYMYMQAYMYIHIAGICLSHL